jgi:hypothetical protein
MKQRAGPTGPARGALAGINYEPAMGLTAACGVWMTDDFAWAGSESSGGGGGGAVDSVNGYTGVVVLGASDVGAQPVDTLLTNIAALSMVADRYIYGTGTDTVALGTITSFARSILDDVDAAAVRTTIGAGTGSGDVVGPASATDNAVARYDGTTGKLVQSSGIILSDGDLLSGVEGLSLDQRAASPGSGYLWTSDGTTYTAGTLLWGADAQVLGELGVGNPGNEQGSILLGGTTYTAPFKVNAFGSLRSAAVLHQHSNSVEPDLVFARSRGTTSSHSQVTDTTILGRLIWSGWIDGTTGYARGAEVRAVIDGTPSGSSAPTRLDFATTASGALTPTDRWCILPGGTFRPAADNAYQVGNVTYTVLDVWSYQYSGKEQAAAQAPSGGWTGRWAYWGKTGAPSEPMYTDDGGTDRRLIMRTDIGTTSAAGVFEAATAAEQSSTTVLTSDDHRLIYTYPPDKCGSRTSAGNAAGSGTGFLEGITYFATPARNYIAGFGHIDSNTSSTSADRGWYLTPATNSHLTFAKLVGSRVSAKFAVPSDNLRGFVAFTEAGAPTLVPANAGNVLEVIRLGVYNNVFTWSISDGTNETTGSLTAVGHTAGNVYEYEIIWTSSTSVTFNIYNADRSTLLETTTRTTGIPASGSTTTCYIGVFIRAASTTPTVYYGLGRLRIP